MIAMYRISGGVRDDHDDSEAVVHRGEAATKAPGAGAAVGVHRGGSSTEGHRPAGRSRRPGQLDRAATLRRWVARTAAGRGRFATPRWVGAVGGAGDGVAGCA